MAGALDDTVSLITGASSGIGQATARALAARVAINELLIRPTEQQR